MWPALLPTPKLNSFVGSDGATEPMPQGCTGCSGCASCTRQMLSLQADQGPSTERVEHALGLAFDRLWRDRPVEEDRQDDAAEFSGTVDGYITNYFRHVAELSRESVYQSHQRAILNRMREDIVAGDRSGNMRDLEERLQKVELNDKSLQAEIATRMRIVEREQRASRSCGDGRSSCCTTQSGCCMSDDTPKRLQEPGGRTVPDCTPGCTLQ